MHKLSQRNALSLNPAPYPGNPALLPHPLGGQPEPTTILMPVFAISSLHCQDYGTLLCWATNEIGDQSEPCVYTIVPAGE